MGKQTDDEEEKKINYLWPFVGRSTNCSNPELGRMSSLHTSQATHQAGAYPAVSVTWSDWSLALNLPVLISTPGKETQTVSCSRAQLNHRANRRLNQNSESGKNCTVLSWYKCIILKKILKEVSETSASSLFLLAAKTNHKPSRAPWLEDFNADFSIVNIKNVQRNYFYCYIWMTLIYTSNFIRFFHGTKTLYCQEPIV